ncbi:MAG: TIGR02266 family protein [Myxococcales bacterium]|nr:TIGR02266 family protein [Myxococcales bacterium]
MTKATTEPLAIRAKLGYATTAVFIEKFGPNVSQKGFFLKTKAPKPQGTSLRFLLRIDDDTTVLRGIGTVAWVRESDIDGKPAGMGIRFDRVDAATRDIIRQIAAHKQANNIAGPSRYSEAPEAVTEVDLQDVDSLLANLSGAPEAEAEEAEAARKAEEAEAARKAEEAAARKAAEEAAARKAAEEAAARKAAEEAAARKAAEEEAARKAAEEAAARKAAEEAAARKAAEEEAARKAAEEAAARKAAEEAAARKAAEEAAARKAAEEAAARAAQKVAQDLGKIEADDFEIDDVISAFDTIQVAEQVAPEVPGGQIKITAAGMDDGVRFEVSSSAEFDASMEAVAAPAPAPAVVPAPASVPAPPVASVPASVPAPPVIPYSDTATADEAFFFSDGDEIEELSFSDGDEIEELSFSDGDEIEELSFSDGDEIEELSFSDGDEIEELSFSDGDNIEELSFSEETPSAVENAISDATPKPRVTTGGWSEALFSADIHEAEADLAAVAFASDMGALDEIENPDTYRIDAASDDPMAAFIDRAASETRMPKSPTAPLMSTDETLDTAIEDMFAPGALMPGAAKSSPEPVLDEAPDALPDDALPPSLAAHVMRRRSLAPPPPMPEESVPPLAPKPSWPPEDYVPDDDDDLDFPPKRRGLFGKIFGKK